MVILVVGTLVGMGLSVLLWYQRSGVGETLTWAIVYSIFWWYLGPLTLQPLFQGDNLTWDVASAQSAFPIFWGHVVYGSSTGFFWLCSEPRTGCGPKPGRSGPVIWYEEGWQARWQQGCCAPVYLLKTS